MEFYQPIKKAKLDFSRPTFNEANIKLPAVRDTLMSMPGNVADDERSANDSDCLQTTTATAVNDAENVNVFLRIRPAKEVCSLYEFHASKVVVSQADHTKTTEKHYSFTSVLNEAVDQVQIYDQIVRPTLSNPFGCTGATFASYGVSSSGKTFTILGDSDCYAGLVPRAITQIFTEFESIIAEFPCVKITRDEIKELNDEHVLAEIDALTDYTAECAKMNKSKPKLRSWSPESIRNEHSFQSISVDESMDRIYIWVSFVEIYNEKITDLLFNSPAKSTLKTLKIFSNNGHSYIPGLTWLFVSDIHSALNVLKYGLSKVSYASTGINDHSSRSHTIFTINMISENKAGFQVSSYKFCDLAGAERTKKTGNMGDRLKEAGGINNSLLVLGRCLEAVHQNQSKVNKKMPDIVVPVRDSKLTLLIQSSLLGLEKFFMIVNLYPTSDFFEENLNVLKFGSIANQIVVRQAEVRKFKRQSSRFSYLLQNQNNTSIKMSLNETINEDEREFDESELDISYRWDQMSNEQLKEQLRKRDREIEVLREIFVKKEQDYVNAEMKLRQEAVKQQASLGENLLKRHTEDKEQLEKYYERKMENLKKSYERKLSEAFDEIEDLRRELKKEYLNNNSNKNIKCQEEDEYEDSEEEEEEEEEQSCEEDLIEIDD